MLRIKKHYFILVIALFLIICSYLSLSKKEEVDPAENLKGKWKVTELVGVQRTGTSYWDEETYLGRSIEISDNRIEKSIDYWPGYLYKQVEEYQFCRNEEIPAERVFARAGLNSKRLNDRHRDDMANYISFYKNKSDFDNDYPFDKYAIIQDGNVYTELYEGWYKIEPYVQACTDIKVEDLFGEWEVKRLVSYEEGWIGERSMLELNRGQIDFFMPEMRNWEEAEGIDFRVKEYYGDVLLLEPNKICLQSESGLKEEHGITQFETYTCNTRNYQYMRGIHDELGIINDEIQVIAGQFEEGSEQSLLDGDIVVIDNKNIIVKIERGWYLLEKTVSNVSSDISDTNSDISHLYQMEEADRDYKLTIRSRGGNIIFNEQYGAEPIVQIVDDDTLLIICGKGSWHSYTFVNVDTGLVSEGFEDISAWNSEMVVYAVWQDGTYKVVVQDIYNKSDYYMEIERDFSPMAVPHFIIKEATFLDDSTLEMKYYCGENFEIKGEIIDLQSNDEYSPSAKWTINDVCGQWKVTRLIYKSKGSYGNIPLGNEIGRSFTISESQIIDSRSEEMSLKRAGASAGIPDGKIQEFIFYSDTSEQETSEEFSVFTYDYQDKNKLVVWLHGDYYLLERFESTAKIDDLYGKWCVESMVSRGDGEQEGIQFYKIYGKCYELAKNSLKIGMDEGIQDIDWHIQKTDRLLFEEENRILEGLGVLDEEIEVWYAQKEKEQLLCAIPINNNEIIVRSGEQWFRLCRMDKYIEPSINWETQLSGEWKFTQFLALEDDKAADEQAISECYTKSIMLLDIGEYVEGAVTDWEIEAGTVDDLDQNVRQSEYFEYFFSKDDVIHTASRKVYGQEETFVIINNNRMIYSGNGVCFIIEKVE